MDLRADLKKYLVEKYLNLVFNGLDSFENSRDKLKLKLFNDFTSGDESKVLDAAKIIRHLDNLYFTKNELDEIKISTSNLPESDICTMYDYRLDIKEGVEIIDNYVLGNCKCVLYPLKERFSPEREIEFGLVELIEEPFVNQDMYQIEYKLRCIKCKTEWTAIEQHSYHYPWTQWTKK